jgi:hypothetical protein
MTEKLVEVYRAKGESQAEIIRGLLESYGIPSMLRSNAAPSAFQFTVDEMGEYKVMVWEKDAAAARELIESGSEKIEEEENK